MNCSKRSGFTLFEVLVASAIFTGLAIMALSAMMSLLKLVDTQDVNIKMDQAANRALREVADQLKLAILPIYLEKVDREDTDGTFYDIDNKKYGFGNEVGEDWRDLLVEGADCIAFVHSIDAQRVGSFLDDANHIQIGQTRGDRSFLSATESGNPNNDAGPAHKFTIRQGSEMVNALAAMDPALFAADSFANIPYPTVAQWNALQDSRYTWPTRTSFLAFRFVPKTDASGEPVLITEKNAFRGKFDLDLDGDGTIDGSYQIGHLQLAYSGGKHSWVDADFKMAEADIDPIYVPMTPMIVLRKNEPSERTPMFRLVDFDRSNIQDKSGDAEAVGTTKQLSTSTKNDRNAVAIRLLMLDNVDINLNDLASGKAIHSPYMENITARWYDTIVVLRGMER